MADGVRRRAVQPAGETASDAAGRNPASSGETGGGPPGGREAVPPRPAAACQAGAPPQPAPKAPAPPPVAPKDRLDAIQVEPAKFLLRGKWSTQNLVVMGRFGDGAVRDVTARAEFKSANAKVAEVGKDGTVRPVSDGEAVISVVAQAGGPPVTAEARATVKDSADTLVYFASDVMPLVTKLGCNQSTCHGSQRGKGGFRLSMFAAEPEFDFESFTKVDAGRTINRVEPSQELVPLGGHGQRSPRRREAARPGLPAVRDAPFLGPARGAA